MKPMEKLEADICKVITREVRNHLCTAYLQDIHPEDRAEDISRHMITRIERIMEEAIDKAHGYVIRLIEQAR